MDENLIDTIKNHHDYISKTGGNEVTGFAGGFDSIEPIVKMKIPKINLSKKWVIWWRAIEGRKAEVMGRMELPRKVDDVIKCFHTRVLPRALAQGGFATRR